MLTLFTGMLASTSTTLPAEPTQPQTGVALKAPKIWDEEALKTWALPVAGVKSRPNFYSEAEYYAAPVAEYRTYPVYHPDREPPGYMEWLRAQEPKPVLDMSEIKSDADWATLGKRVFDELDVPRFRTDDPRAINALRDRELLKDSPATLTADGQYLIYRWVVEARGRVKLSVTECAGCHVRVQPDGTLLRGAPRNLSGDRIAFPIMLAQGRPKSDDTGEPLSLSEWSYAQFGVPWLGDDIHQGFRTMTADQMNAVARSAISGTVARFNGSPYFTTKVPDLIGVRDRRYLDATGTHRNRGPEDIARYGALVSTADDGSIGAHRFLSDRQRQMRYRHSDEALYAIARFLYALEPPTNPNPFDERARRGKAIFHEEGCAKCHTPPVYTNNKLTRVDGFDVPNDHPERSHIVTRSVHTDPALALRTRKGTGLYKIPTLRGLWYRGLYEHSGSVNSLEDWFDPKRLEPTYVPSGWKGPGVTARAVPGHEFGLDLPPEDVEALIAFLKCL